MHRQTQVKKKSSMWRCVFPNTKKGRVQLLAGVATEEDKENDQNHHSNDDTNKKDRAVVDNFTDMNNAASGMQRKAVHYIRNNRLHTKCAKIKSMFRGAKQRKRSLITRKSVVCIQSRFRKAKAIRRVDSVRQDRRAAITIQSTFRRRMATWHATSLKEELHRDLMATKLQSVVRRRQAMKRIQLFLEFVRQVRELIRGNSAIAIQSVVRSFQAQGIFLASRNSTIAIQSVVRSKHARGRFLASRNAVVKLQAFVRSRKVIRHVKMVKGAQKIQRLFRKLKIRQFVLVVRDWAMEYRERKAAQMVIKGFVRKMMTRQFVLVVRDWAVEHRFRAKSNICLSALVEEPQAANIDKPKPTTTSPIILGDDIIAKKACPGQVYQVNKQGFGFRVCDVPYGLEGTEEGTEKCLCGAIAAFNILKSFGSDKTAYEVVRAVRGYPTIRQVLDYLNDEGLEYKYHSNLYNSRVSILRHTGGPLLAFVDFFYEAKKQGHAICYLPDSRNLIDNGQSFEMSGSISSSKRGSKKDASIVFHAFFLEETAHSYKTEISIVCEIFQAPPKEGADDN